MVPSTVLNVRAPEVSLLRMLEDWCPMFPSFFLYHPSRRLIRPVLRAVINHVVHSGR